MQRLQAITGNRNQARYPQGGAGDLRQLGSKPRGYTSPDSISHSFQMNENLGCKSYVAMRTPGILTTMTAGMLKSR